MRSIFPFVIGLLLVNQLSFGQSEKQPNYFAFRAGYLQTKTDLTSSRSDTYLGGIANRNSFYGGVFYHNKVTRFLAYRIELNYQQKGVENQDFSGNVLFQRRFHYVGVTPLVGLTPITGLGLYIGPEANVRLGRVPLGRSENPIEVGISSRIAYRYKWIGVEVGYFKAFNKFTSIELGPDLQFGMKNRTWQAGLFFTPRLGK